MSVNVEREKEEEKNIYIYSVNRKIRRGEEGVAQ